MVKKRIRLAQNFFRDRRLVASMVAASSLGPNDIVYEVGPGTGIITRELALRAGRVIAVEKDAVLAGRLRARFRDTGNVTIRAGDFLDCRILERDYRLFANIPFNITAAVVRRILFGVNPPCQAHLVVQEEAAARFVGVPAETEISVLAKPRFALRVVHRFHRTDFAPKPRVDVVLLNIFRRSHPLIARPDVRTYERFVRLGFEAWQKDLGTAYRHLFTRHQWRRLSENLGFPARATPTQLTFGQWLGLFDYLRVGVPVVKKAWLMPRGDRTRP